MAAEIQVQGLRDLAKALKEIDPDLRKELREVNRESALPIASTARSLVPTRSGDLQRSIKTSGTQRSGVVKAGSRSVPYAGVIEFGWPRRGIRAQSYLWAALDKHRDQIADAYVSRLQKFLDETFPPGVDT